MNERELRPGDRFRITRIDRPDPDHYAVIHYEGGGAFGCSREWFERNRPAVGRYVVIGRDNHWCVDQVDEMRMAWQNLDRALVYLPNEQLCGVWPDGSALRGEHIKNLIKELRESAAPPGYDDCTQLRAALSDAIVFADSVPSNSVTLARIEKWRAALRRVNFLTPPSDVRQRSRGGEGGHIPGF